MPVAAKDEIQAAEIDPRLAPTNRLPNGEFKKSDDEPLGVDEATPTESNRNNPRLPADDKQWAERDAREQEKRQRG